MASSSVQRLPIELLANIFGYLSTRDLSSLCLVSNLYLDVARPLLYRSYRQETKWPANSIRQFGRTLTANPALGSHVRSFGACDWVLAGAEEDASYGEADQEWKRKIDAEQKKLIAKLFSLSGREVSDNTISQYFLGFLLSRMPNVESLSIKLLPGNNTFVKSVTYALNSWNHDERPFLRHVKTLDLDWYDVESGWSLAKCQPLLELPCLEELRGRRCSDDYLTYGSKPDRRLENFDTKIKSIKLCHSVICEDALEHLVAGSPDLEELCLGMSEDRIGNLIELDISRAVKALAQSSSSLKRLAWQFEPDVHMNVSEWTGVGDFSVFSQLDRLDIPGWALLGLDTPKTSVDDALERLPRSLSFLVIRYVDGLAQELASKILEHRSSHFPALKSIALLPDEKATDLSPEVTEQLRSGYDAAGISFNDQRDLPQLWLQKGKILFPGNDLETLTGSKLQGDIPQ